MCTQGHNFYFFVILWIISIFLWYFKHPIDVKLSQWAAAHNKEPHQGLFLSRILSFAFPIIAVIWTFYFFEITFILYAIITMVVTLFIALLIWGKDLIRSLAGSIYIFINYSLLTSKPFIIDNKIYLLHNLHLLSSELTDQTGKRFLLPNSFILNQQIQFEDNKE